MWTMRGYQRVLQPKLLGFAAVLLLAVALAPNGAQGAATKSYIITGQASLRIFTAYTRPSRGGLPAIPPTSPSPSPSAPPPPLSPSSPPPPKQPQLAYAHLGCVPQLGPDGYLTDAGCELPPLTLAEGPAALALQEQLRLLSGEVGQLRLNVSVNATAGAQLLSAGRPPALLSYTPVTPSGVLDDPSSLFPASSSASLPTVVFLLDTCGWKNPFRSAQGFKKYLLGDVPGAVENNLQSLLHTCSLGAMQLRPESTLVLGPFAVPCSGNTRILTTTTANSSSSAPSGTVRLTAGWDASQRCGAAEVEAWRWAAERKLAKAAARGGPDSTAALLASAPRHYRSQGGRTSLLLLPDQLPCGWSALGEAGCGGPSCEVLMRAGLARQPQVLLHELMHTRGVMRHAASGGDPAGDPSDPLGDLSPSLTSASSSSAPNATTKLLCPNAVSASRLGWAAPIASASAPSSSSAPNASSDSASAETAPGTISSSSSSSTSSSSSPRSYGRISVSSFSYGDWIRGLILPVAGTTANSFIEVHLGAASINPYTWQPVGATVPYPTIYLSYRVRNKTYGGYDSGLPEALSRKVHIHTFNGSLFNPRDYNVSNLEDWGPRFNRPDPASDWAGNGDMWASEFALDGATGLGGSLVVRVVSVGPTEAVVDLCRRTVAREDPYDDSCYDGLDNDCDNRVDEWDPDCLIR
ncbi:hypothetical protein Agub_g2744 [Astrephomene gubernaculifera]|uniref:Peptidase M11 gametolysin domain-containing protein n=1 Tax=Astrephomene gubernaculifera TaxID=47775 RepID=A0AAD3DIQ1_9CHLO|nr:hypothetical protein Agub_g2744 [Astrephomene gubernaculifera]